MKRIKLHTPTHLRDSETQTEFDVQEITGVKSVSGDDDQQGTHFYLAGLPQRQYCLEPAKKVREMIAQAKSKEEIELDAEAIDLLVRGSKSADGAMHFIEGDGFLGIVVGDYKPEPFRGRLRSKYEHIRDQLESQDFIVSKGGGLYLLTERGYAMSDFLLASHSDLAFHGYVKLPAGRRPAVGLTLNQNNYNDGDVNNAIQSS